MPMEINKMKTALYVIGFLLIFGLFRVYSTRNNRKAKKALNKWVQEKDGVLLKIIDIGKLAEMSESGTVRTELDQKARIDVTGVGYFYVDGGVEIKFLWRNSEGKEEERWGTYVPSSGLFKVRSL